MKFRVISILLSLVILLSCCAVTAFAEESTQLSQQEWEALRLTNLEREAQGVSPLTATYKLQQATDIRAKELEQKFDHTRPDGTRCFSVLSQVGLSSYLTAGENIAAGAITPAQVVNMWMNSSGHRANILNSNFVHMGMGNYGYYWVQLFYTGVSCNYSSMAIDNADQLTFPLGTTIEQMHLTAVLQCNGCGESYLPVSSTYCVGYNPDQVGTQTVTVTCLGQTTTFQVTLEKQFADVSKSDYYYSAVMWAYNNGITAGIDENHFAPNAASTREQVVSFLWRAAGRPEPDVIQIPFLDVQQSAYYEKAVLWAYAQNIVAGVDDTHFAPKQTITREQFVAFLWRLAGRPEAGETTPFVDVAPDSYSCQAIAWAAENGITAGIDATHFAPQSPCTRGQIVTFLYRYFGK